MTDLEASPQPRSVTAQRPLVVLMMLYLAYIGAFYGGLIPIPLGNPETDPATLRPVNLVLALDAFTLALCVWALFPWRGRVWTYLAFLRLSLLRAGIAIAWRLIEPARL